MKSTNPVDCRKLPTSAAPVMAFAYFNGKAAAGYGGIYRNIDLASKIRQSLGVKK